jgi:uncharacterized UPF0146 family protein
MKKEGYTVVPTKSPEDIRNFSKKGKKMLFVVDDVPDPRISCYSNRLFSANTVEYTF